MKSLSFSILVLAVVLNEFNFVTQVKSQDGRVERAPRSRSSSSSSRRSQSTTEDPSSVSEEFGVEIGTFSMDGWTDGEKLFMKQSDNAKHEPMDEHGNRIVGGNYTFIAQFPYQLQLNVDERARCGASIISHHWAITAAHCMSHAGRLYPLELLSLRCGATIKDMGGRVHRIASRIIHPEYSATDRVRREHDIALLKVKVPFRISFLVQPIRLPAANHSVAVGNMAVVSGWGHTSYLGNSSNILQQVKIPIVSHSECVESYYPMQTITRRMICAGQQERDSCQGDSGGPLTYDNKLIGIVSFGHGCGYANFPGVYTKVSKYRSFIQEHTRL